MNCENIVLIVEDELITANGVSDLLTEEGFSVAGIADDAGTALRLFAEMDAKPDVVLCDIHIKGDIHGIDLARKLKEMYKCEIIFLTAYADSKTLHDAFATEPVMYIVKPFSDKQLLTALHMAFYRMIKRRDVQVAKKEIVLTKREKEIAGLIMQGFTSRQIAAQLFISLQTVKTHRRSMLQRNDMRSFSQLAYHIDQ